MIENSGLFFALATGCGFLMACAVGANDVANAMGTSVGARIITLRQAIIIAAIFEALGALLASGHVTQTIGSNMIDVQHFATTPHILILGMIASLLASGVWLALATVFKWPVSTTHSIIGAIIGFTLVTMGFHSVHWSVLSNIALTWFLTPIIAGTMAWVLFNHVESVVFHAKDPVEKAKKTMPYYLFFVVLIVALITLQCGLKSFGVHLKAKTILLDASAFSLAAALISKHLWLPSWIQRQKKRHEHVRVERIFGILAIFTACAMAFAHGSNDTANAIGPLSMVINILSHGGIPQNPMPPTWVILLGASGIGLGLGVYGYRVMETVGVSITHLTPSRSFVAQFSTATTIIVSSALGLPVSTTQVLVGAVLGVGIARGIDAINLTVVRNIFASWIITLPAGALLSIGFFHTLKWVLY